MAETRLDTLQPVELADGVEIHLRVAGPAVRSTAWLIDCLIWMVGIFVVMLLLNLLVARALGFEMTQGLSMLFLFLSVWFYNVLFEASPRGCTPGQKWMKLRVVSVSGTPVTASRRSGGGYGRRLCRSAAGDAGAHDSACGKACAICRADA